MQDNGKDNNGYGIVEFSNEDECKKASEYCKREIFKGERLSATPLPQLLKPSEIEVGSLYISIIY